jgi:hypothetical protein
MQAQPSRPTHCLACGKPIDQPTSGVRKWCSLKCRKRQYDLTCVACGRRVEGFSSPERRTAEAPRCYRCARGTPTERFWIAVGQPPATGCWPWRGKMHPEGYGQISVNGRPEWAHRLAYSLLVGRIPEGLQIDHLCRNRACVNPAHLEPVTARENTLRGEGAGARNARKTHCVRGHEFTPENTVVDARGHRSCLACRASRRRDVP